MFQLAEEEKRATRVMIFSQYRDSVYEIAELFTAHQPLVKAMSFVGQSTGKSKGNIYNLLNSIAIK